MQFEERAFADFNKAIALDPSHAAAYVGRGRSYLFMGDHDHAIADLTQAIELKPDDFSVHSAYQWRTWVYFFKSDMKRAEADRAKARELGNMLENAQKKKD